MNSVIYKNPVISAIIINILSLIIYIYLTSRIESLFGIFLIFVGAFNRQVIDNGNNLDKKKKIIIYISFLLMITISLTYAFYMYKVRYNQIISGL